jgi:hypothetical protein
MIITELLGFYYLMIKCQNFVPLWPPSWICNAQKKPRYIIKGFTRNIPAMFTFKWFSGFREEYLKKYFSKRIQSYYFVLREIVIDKY